MSEDHIRYDILVQEALRTVVRKVMAEVAKTGLPGDHHFFISFITHAPGVRISERLLEQYEKEMTIVIQNQYWDFKVSETGFEIGLSFDGQSEILEIPYSAVKGFFDPSVQFGLQFDVDGDAREEPEADADNSDIASLDIAKDNKEENTSTVQPDKKDKTEKKEGDKKIVSLDSFRKKP